MEKACTSQGARRVSLGAKCLGDVRNCSEDNLEEIEHRYDLAAGDLLCRCSHKSGKIKTTQEDERGDLRIRVPLFHKGEETVGGHYQFRHLLENPIDLLHESYELIRSVLR